jgi:hypothetical protein
MSTVTNQQVGNSLPIETRIFLEKDWYKFRVWVFLFGFLVFSLHILNLDNSKIAKIDRIQGKVSKVLAADIAEVYLALTHEQPGTIQDIEYLSFNTISEKNGSRFFQLKLNYIERDNNGIFQPIKQDLFFDDSGWVQAYGSLN